MRRLFLTLVAIVLLVSPLTASECDARENSRLHLTSIAQFDCSVEFRMVSCTGAEGFTILNHTLDDVDLRDYYVTDGEGKVRFTEKIILKPLFPITIMLSEPEDWMGIDSYYLNGQNGIVVEKKFTLADGGDDLYLMKGDEVVDSFAWGSVYNNGWQGNGLPKIPKKSIALRDFYLGIENSADSWRIYVPGMTQHREYHTSGDAQVITFSFPESDGDEIIWALQSAEEYVCISIYTMTHPRVFSALADLLKRGIQVRILVEGSPVGGLPTDEIQYLAALDRQGADIHIIRTNDSYKRYQYVHSKYAVIDGTTAIVTSENWSESSFSSNRGWGCIIENEGFACTLKAIFESDFDITKLDILGFRETYPTAISKKIDDFVRSENTYASITADVTCILAPDYSKEALYSYLSEAQERLYSQQLYVEYDWAAGGNNPLTIMKEAGKRGVDSRILVDVTYDDPLDTDYKDGYGIYTFYEDDPYLDVKYENSTLFGMAHNKGIVCDDSVWIGSMNWTENSINSNREVSVIIDSKEIADFFAALFLEDWNGSYQDGMILNVNVPDVEYGKEITLDATHSIVPTGSTFEWDLDGDGESERKGKTATWRFYKDTECLLKVTDMEGNVQVYQFPIRIPEKVQDESIEEKTDGFLDSPLKYVPLVLICAIIIVVKRIRSR